MKRIEKLRVPNRKPNRKLIGLRVNAGLSPNELGRLIGVSGPTIRLAEKGHTPEPRVQHAIAEYFELQPLDIFSLERQRALA
jgi:DNA-binding XRE family transcriptional regulator